MTSGTKATLGPCDLRSGGGTTRVGLIQSPPSGPDGALLASRCHEILHALSQFGEARYLWQVTSLFSPANSLTDKALQHLSGVSLAPGSPRCRFDPGSPLSYLPKCSLDLRSVTSNGLAVEQAAEAKRFEV